MLFMSFQTNVFLRLVQPWRSQVDYPAKDCSVNRINGKNLSLQGEQVSCSLCASKASESSLFSLKAVIKRGGSKDEGKSAHWTELRTLSFFIFCFVQC